ncbi:AraC family transcriptional regulator [Patulibacter sp. S7RM1-6]
MSPAAVDTGADGPPSAVEVWGVRVAHRVEGHGASLHAQHQLMWSPDATTAMEAGGNAWVLPPTHALWIPGGVVHTGRVLRPGRIYLVYVEPDGCPIRWTRPTGLAVGPLMRELLPYLGRRDLDGDRRRRAEGVLFDVLEPATVATIHVPMPRDPRAREVADALVERPDDDRDLGAWGLEVGASIRTLARLFAAETGMTFAGWRAQVRMRAALGLLADGLPVETVARRVGYRSASAFITAFRRVTGQTPGARAAAADRADATADGCATGARRSAPRRPADRRRSAGSRG